MIGCIERSDFAESFVAYQCLLPFESSLLVMAEIEGESLARQLGVRRATLLQRVSCSLDLGIQKLMDTVNIIQTFLLILINHFCWRNKMMTNVLQRFLLVKTC